MEGVLESYPTLSHLWQAYHKTITEAMAAGRDGVAAARGLLTGLPLSGGRTMSSAMSARVYDMLFCKNANLAGTV